MYRQYRSSVHATTGVTPNSLFLKREVRTKLDLLQPDPEARVLEEQYQQKTACGHDQHARNRQFSVGDSVMAKNFHSGSSWVPATIVSKLGPLSYLIETDDSQVMRRHVDHLKSRSRVNESESQSPTTKRLAWCPLRSTTLLRSNCLIAHA